MRVKNVRLHSCLFPVGDQSNCKMHGMAVSWEREWMTWGKMVRQALQACAQKCELILHFFFTPASLLYVSAPLFFLRKSDMFVAPTVLVMEHCEDNPHMLSKSVCPLNGEPPSTSSPTYQFGLNPVEMSKSCREQKGLTHRGPLCSRGPRRRFSVRRGSLSLQARVKQTHRKRHLSHTNIQRDALLTQFCCQKPQTSESPLPVWKRSISPGLILFFLFFFQHPFTTHPPRVFSSCKSGCGISWESALSWQGESLFPPSESFLRRCLCFFWHPNLCVYVCTHNSFLALSRCCNGLDLMQHSSTYSTESSGVKLRECWGSGALQLRPRWCLVVHGDLLLFSSLYLKRRVCVKLSST